MRRLAAVAVAAVLLAGCSGGATHRLATNGAPTTSTTSGAETAATTVAPSGGGTPTSVAPTATTAAVKAVGARQAVADPSTTVVATTTTTGAVAASTTTTSSTSVAPTSTTVASTTTTLQSTPALGLKSKCQGRMDTAVPEAVDLAQLESDMRARGYAMPQGFQFRDSATGKAIPPALERNLDDANQQWTQCAVDLGVAQAPPLMLMTTAGSDSSAYFAGLVKAQLDSFKFRSYGGSTVQ